MTGPLVTCSDPGCTVTGSLSNFRHGSHDGVLCARHALCTTHEWGSWCAVCHAFVVTGVEGAEAVLRRAQLRSVEAEIAATQHEVAWLARILDELTAARLDLAEVKP